MQRPACTETKITPGCLKIPLKVFVTGGAGFLGQHIARLLLKDNAVRVFDVSDSGRDAERLREIGADYVRGDVLDYKALEESCRGFDAVIHLAARTSVVGSMEVPEDTIRTNVEGTVNVLRSCVQNRIKRVVLASSAAVYGDCDGTPLSEDARTEPSSPYGQSKLEAERQMRDFSEKFGICGVCLRLFNVYGMGQKRENAGVIPRLIEEVSQGRQAVVRGDGAQTRDFVAASDASAAFALALKAAKPATYNIASGRATTVNELVQMVAEILGKDVAPKYVDRRRGEIRHSAADIALAQRELGFEPKIGLGEGLRDLASVPDQVCH